MSFRTLFALIFCNLIWSAHPLMGKILLLRFSPAQVAWLRYMSAFVAYACVAWPLRLWSAGRKLLHDEPFLIPRSGRDWGFLVALSFSAFFLSPLLQLSGLASSRATDGALIVAMEPLLTVFIAWLMLREPPTGLHLIAFAFAFAGFAMLTGLSPALLKQGLDPHLTGNLMILLGLVGEALYSVLGRKLMDRHPPSAIFGSSIAFGALGLTLLICFNSPGLPSLSQFSHLDWRSLVAVIWIGPLGTALSYFYWMTALQKAPVANIALTLFIQPILGPVWGMLLLGDRLTSIQAIGSGLILLAVFGQTWIEALRSLSKTDNA